MCALFRFKFISNDETIMRKQETSLSHKRSHDLKQHIWHFSRYFKDKHGNIAFFNFQIFQGMEHFNAAW